MKFSLVFAIVFLALTIEAALTPEQKIKAEQFTSVFENSTTKLQYKYAEDIGDGRGITSGRAGFCTGTGDAHEVVKRYNKISPGNPLEQYFPELERLKRLSDQGKDASDTSNLEGYEDAWAESAMDGGVFKKVQDSVVDDYYYNPAMAHADRLGVDSPLGRLWFYDTIINQGDGDEGESIGGILKQVNNRMDGKSPKNGADEHDWIKMFGQVRKEILDTDRWGHAGTRGESFLALCEGDHWDLDGVIPVKGWGGESFKLDGKLHSDID